MTRLWSGGAGRSSWSEVPGLVRRWRGLGRSAPPQTGSEYGAAGGGAGAEEWGGPAVGP